MKHNNKLMFFYYMILIIYNQLNFFFAVPLTKSNADVNIKAQLSICGRVVFSKALN